MIQSYLWGDYYGNPEEFFFIWSDFGKCLEAELFDNRIFANCIAFRFLLLTKGKIVKQYSMCPCLLSNQSVLFIAIELIYMHFLFFYDFIYVLLIQFFKIN